MLDCRSVVVSKCPVLFCTATPTSEVVPLACILCPAPSSFIACMWERAAPRVIASSLYHGCGLHIACMTRLDSSQVWRLSSARGFPFVSSLFSGYGIFLFVAMMRADLFTHDAERKRERVQGRALKFSMLRDSLRGLPTETARALSPSLRRPPASLPSELALQGEMGKLGKWSRSQGP